MSAATNKLLTAVLVLQVFTLAGQWSAGSGGPSAVRAEIPDPANRQMQMIDGIKDTNAKLDKLVDVLTSGQVQVQVVKPDDKAK